jgi:hypothetical protein
MFSKAKRYMRKGSRMSDGVLGYLKDNPVLAAGLAVVIGTMAVTKGGSTLGSLMTGTEKAKPARVKAAKSRTAKRVAAA